MARNSIPPIPLFRSTDPAGVVNSYTFGNFNQYGSLLPTGSLGRITNPINNNNNNNYAADQTSVSVSKNKTYTNLWKIEDFARQRNPAMISGVYSGENYLGEEVKWHFSLNTHLFIEKEVVNYVIHYDIFFIKIDCVFETKTDNQNVEIQIENGDDTPISGFVGQTKFTFKWTRDTILPTWLSSDGSLILRFKVTLINNVLEATSSKQHHTLPLLPPSVLVENIASLLQNEQFTDLTIIAGQKSFRAHKTILVARSTVFAAMFQHDMQESKRNEVTITDVEPEVFGEVLRFIYTDKVEGLPRMADKLLAAADKYDLARLKVMCEIQLCRNITAESATKMLQFADLHRAKELRARAIEFLARNLKTVSNWEEFCSVRPDLVAEILKKIASYN